MEFETTHTALGEVRREDLYEQVWSIPISHLAARFEVSGSYLARVCNALRVPRPPLGYWQQKAVGKAPPRPELPAARPGDQLIWSKDRPLNVPTKVPILLPARLPRARADNGKSSGLRRHPLLVGVEPHFRKSRSSEEGEFLRPFKRLLPDILASEACLVRTLDVANEIYSALEQRGHRVLIASPDGGMKRGTLHEQEAPQRDSKYGRYGINHFWAPDRPTVTFVGAVPIGLILTEMTERVTVRYLDGKYVREDSLAVRSARPRQLVHSWTTEQDLPSGRLRLIAYSPVNGVDWTATWQETRTASMSSMVSAIVRKLQASEAELQALMVAAEEAAARRHREWEEAQERYRRTEDKRLVAQALADSKRQLGEVIEKWAAATAIEQFFEEAERRLGGVEGERAVHLRERLALAREMVGAADPLAHLESWLAPAERYRTKYPDE